MIMKHILKLLLLSCLLNVSCGGRQGVFVSCSNVSSEVNEENYLTNAYGTPVRWNYDSLPITIVVSPTFDQFETEAIQQSVNYWNEVVGREIFVMTIGLSNDIYFVDDVITITEHDLTNDCGRHFLGLTTRRRIYDIVGVPLLYDSAHIEIHDKHVHNSSYIRTIVHELGHAIGLFHDDNIGSVMYPSILDGEWFIEPEDLEYIRSFFE